ncbi:TetR/AcrR family transcriptional regulator [Actinomycetes bacterium KLBMP 9759]
MTAPVARRPGGRSARVRATVRDAVLAELAEHGFDALTVDAVAARSGVHRTTIYRRWTDVGGLLADALDAAGDDGWEPPDTGSLAGDLVELNRQVHAALVEEPSVASAVIAASFRSEQAAAALRAFWADRYTRCAVVVERAVERGELAAGTKPEPVLIAATAPIFHHHMLLGVPLTGEQVDAYAEAASYSSRQAVR